MLRWLFGAAEIWRCVLGERKADERKGCDGAETEYRRFEEEASGERVEVCTAEKREE